MFNYCLFGSLILRMSGDQPYQLSAIDAVYLFLEIQSPDPHWDSHEVDIKIVNEFP
jgi:hypothetical protein